LPISVPGQPGAFGQVVGSDSETHLIFGRLGESTQPVQKAQRLEHGGINANAHGVVASLDPLQRRTACKGPFGNDCRRQSTTAAGVADVGTELAKRSPYRDRGPVGCRHNVIFLLQKQALM
jgi:hypothetical protein